MVVCKFNESNTNYFNQYLREFYMDSYLRENGDYDGSQEKIILEQEKIIKELSTKIAELEEKINHQKQANDTLQVDLAAVKRDRDECFKLLQANSSSPLFYASTNKREEFWKIVNENISFLREKNKYENDTQSRLEEKDDEILKQRITIEHLRKEIANNQVFQETNNKIRLEIDDMYDRLLKEQAKNNDLMIKIAMLEKQLIISEQKEKETAKQLEVIDVSINKRIEAFTEQQKAIGESIKSIKERGYYLQTKGYETFKAESKYFSNDTNIEQFVMRLRTTSIHSDKYAEVTDILVEMLRSIKGDSNPLDERDDFGARRKQYNQAHTLLCKKLGDSRNYKLFVRSLQSSNVKVLISTQSLLFEIGSLETKIEDYIESGSVTILIKNLKAGSDPLLKSNSMSLLRDLASLSPQILQEIYDAGISYFLNGQIKQAAREVAINTDYLLKLLNLTAIMIKGSYGKRELLQNDLLFTFIKILKQSESIDIRKNILILIPSLAEEKEKRLKIYENGDFSYLWGIFVESEKMPDKEMLSFAIQALVPFLKDEKIQLIFMTSDKLYETFGLFARCLNLAKPLPPAARAAALEIVSELLRTATKNEEFERHVFQNNLMDLFLTQLREGEPESQKQCLNTLIFMKEFIFKHAEKIKISLKLLTSLIGSPDKDVIILALRFIDALTDQPKLLDDLANLGIINIIASFFIHNPKELDPAVLVEAGYLLLKFQDNETALHQMLDSQAFLVILPLITYDHPEIKKFWYNALSEFCNHKEFRAQLESQAIYLNFIKRGLYESELHSSEQLCFSLRTLFQSRLLTNYMVDENSINLLFKFFHKFSKQATAEFMVYVLEILALLVQTNEGKYHFLRNEAMIEILDVQVRKEDATIANIAGRLIIFLLQEKKGDIAMLKSMVIDGVMIYAQSLNVQAREYARVILSMLKKDPELAEQLHFLEKQLSEPDATNNIDGEDDDGEDYEDEEEEDPRGGTGGDRRHQ